MKVTITHKDAMQFVAQTAKSSFVIDCPVISPLEYFLSGIIACTASDMVLLPKNQDKSISNLVIEGEVTRPDTEPKKFSTLHLVYSFDSDADDLMAARWVMASLETYCTTVNTIRDATKVSYSIVHNNTMIRENEEMISGGGSGIDLGTIESCPS